MARIVELMYFRKEIDSGGAGCSDDEVGGGGREEV